MSDQRLRELERRVAEGDGAAEAPLLAERVRAGTLAPDRLRLAAYLGHAPAREALGDDAPVLHEDPDSWIRGLADWGPQAWVRAAVAAARLVLPLWEERFNTGEWAERQLDPRLRRALQATVAWLEDPGVERREEAGACADAAMEVVDHFGSSLMALTAEASAGVFRESRASVQAALSATDDLRGVTHAVLASVAARERLSLEALPPNSPMWIRAAEVGRLGELPELTTKDAVQRVRVAVREALVPWALGK